MTDTDEVKRLMAKEKEGQLKSTSEFIKDEMLKKAAKAILSEEKAKENIKFKTDMKCSCGSHEFTLRGYDQLTSYSPEIVFEVNTKEQTGVHVQFLSLKERHRWACDECDSDVEYGSDLYKDLENLVLKIWSIAPTREDYI